VVLRLVRRCRCLVAGQVWGRQQGCQHQACAAEQGSTKTWNSYSKMFCVSSAPPLPALLPFLGHHASFPS
jgi:hypothetical protein